MHRLDTQIEIESPLDRVWAILMDFPGYGRWNPFIRSISGVPAIGATLEVFIQPPGSGGMRFRPRVLVFESGRQLRWKGNLLLPGLFDGDHLLAVERRSDTHVVFHHSEIFSGLFVPLYKRALDTATRQGFLAMNEALKREAERT